MNFYFVNSLSILKRIASKRLPLTTNVIVTRPIVSTCPTPLPIAVANTKINKQNTFDSDSLSPLVDFPISTEIDSKPTIPGTNKDGLSSSGVSVPINPPLVSTNFPLSPLSQPSSPSIPEIIKSLTESFTSNKEDSIKDSNNLDECHEKFILSQLQEKLQISHKFSKQIYAFCGSEIIKNISTKDELNEVFNILQTCLTNDQLLQNPKLLTLPLKDLHNRITVLKNIGFKSIHPAMIHSYSRILELTSKELKQNFKDNYDENCFFDSLSTAFENESSESLKIYLRTLYKDIESTSIQYLRLSAFAYFVSQELKVLPQKVTKSKQNLDKFNSLSLEVMKRSVIVLSKVYDYPIRKIVNDLFFAFVDPDNLLRLYDILSREVGDDKQLFNNLISDRKILTIDSNKLLNNFRLIREKNDNQFHQRSKFFLSMENDQLKKLFKNIEDDPRFESFNIRSYGLDYIASNHTKINQRIDMIEKYEIPARYIPPSVLLGTSKDFTEYLKSTQSCEMRIKFFLETQFGIDYDSVKDKLFVIRDSDMKKYNKENSQKIIEFLISMNIPKDTIVNGIYLIFQDYEHVKDIFNMVLTNSDKVKKKGLRRIAMVVRHLIRSKYSEGNYSESDRDFLKNSS